MLKLINRYILLILWILALILIGSIIGFLTKTEINTWYSTLDRSPLTPPNYVFPIAWTILYTFIAISGWLIWQTSPFSKLRLIKSLYVIQLMLNWTWTPLFFHYHLIGLSFACLVMIDIAVAMIIFLSYEKIRSASLLMSIYLLWILFATYLNFYIWQTSF